MTSNSVWCFIQFVHYLMLSLWIGGIFFLSFAAAPAAHRSLATKAVAGDIVGRILKKLNFIEIMACMILLVTTFSAFRFVGFGNPGLTYLFFLFLFMGLITFYYTFSLTPRLEAIKQRIPTLDSLSKTNPDKQQFQSLHHWYVCLMSINLLLALGALYGSIATFQ